MIPDLKSLLIGGAIAIALLLGSFFYGEHVRGAEDAAAQAKAIVKAIDDYKAQTKEADTATAGIDSKTNQADAATAANAQIIVKRIPFYVQVPATKPFYLSVGTVRLLNASAGDDLSGLPETPGVGDDAPSTVDLPAFVSNVTANYAACNDRGHKLTAWQDWYRTQSAIWEKHR